MYDGRGLHTYEQFFLTETSPLISPSLDYPLALDDGWRVFIGKLYTSNCLIWAFINVEICLRGNEIVHGSVCSTLRLRLRIFPWRYDIRICCMHVCIALILRQTRNVNVCIICMYRMCVALMMMFLAKYNYSNKYIALQGFHTYIIGKIIKESVWIFGLIELHYDSLVFSLVLLKWWVERKGFWYTDMSRINRLK